MESNTFKRTLSDTEIEILMRPHVDHFMNKVVARKNASSSSKNNETHNNTNEDIETDPSDNNEKYSLTPQEKEYLESLFFNPFRSTTGLAEYLGLSAYKNNEFKKKFLELGLVIQVPLNLGKEVGGIIKTLQLTNAGYQALGKTPPALKRPLGCSEEHFVWQQLITRFGQLEGYTTCIEKMLSNGKKVDVVLEKKKTQSEFERIGVEVELTAKNTPINAVKDLETHQLTKLIFACANSKVKEAVKTKLQNNLSEEQMKIVQVMLLSEFKFVKDMIKKTKS